MCVVMCSTAINLYIIRQDAICKMKTHKLTSAAQCTCTPPWSGGMTKLMLCRKPRMWHTLDHQNARWGASPLLVMTVEWTVRSTACPNARPSYKESEMSRACDLNFELALPRQGGGTHVASVHALQATVLCTRRLVARRAVSIYTC